MKYLEAVTPNGSIRKSVESFADVERQVEQIGKMLTDATWRVVEAPSLNADRDDDATG